MPRLKFAGMNCGSKHADKTPKLQIPMMSQLTNKYKHIFRYIKRKDYSDGKNPHTNGSPSHIHSGNLVNFFQIAIKQKQQGN